MTHVNQIGGRELVSSSRKRERVDPDDPAADAALVALYTRMSPERQRDFWQLRGSGLSKATFLLRWGGYGRFAGEATA